MKNILRKISLMMTFIMMICVIPSFSTDCSAFSVTENGIMYSSYEGHIQVYGVDDETITDLVIPETIQDGRIVERVCLYNVSNITSVTIPSTVTYINFRNCSDISAYYVDENNQNYRSQDGVIYDKISETLCFYPPEKSDDSFEVPEGIKKIGPYAFSNCKGIKNITLPEELTEIERSAFNSCELSEITFPDSLNSIGDYAFSDNNLTEIVFPDNLISIGECAFDHNNLSKVILSDKLEKIGNYSFAYNCFSEIELPESLVSLGICPFSYNENLRELTVPENVEDFAGIIYQCPEIETITFMRDVKDSPVQSVGIKDMAYMQALNSDKSDCHNNIITVYVPDNKLDLYYEYADFWKNVEFTIETFSNKPGDFLVGDVNFDKTVSVADIIMLQKGLANFSCVRMWKAGDMNGDGRINVFDAVALRRNLLVKD